MGLKQGDCSGRVAKETGETTAGETGARKVLQWRHVRSPPGGVALLVCGAALLHLLMGLCVPGIGGGGGW